MTKPPSSARWRAGWGHTVLVTNRLGWIGKQVLVGYSGQRQIERVFGGLIDRERPAWGPMDRWRDSKIQVHAFCCLLGISLLQYLPWRTATARPGLNTEQMIEELARIQHFDPLHPRQGKKGPVRVASALSQQTHTQQALAQAVGRKQLGITPRG
ncbi:MAG: hypothetical protein NZ554_03055 [Bryobacteraceae bacterium]|nr:hypothetical protein [Bryobacteraceae bacterium]